MGAEPDTEALAAVARLYYVDGLDQSAVASILGVSRSTVSRLLAAARDRGIVRIEVVPYQPRSTELERQLCERFSLKLAVVVRANDRGTAAVRRAIGYYGAPEIAGLIRDGTAIGVAGGRTLGELVTAMAPGDDAPDIDVVQLMGHVDLAAHRADAAEIGRALAHGYGGVFFGLNAPAFVGDRRTRDALLGHDDIRRIFQRIERLDLALVGIGALEDSLLGERGLVSAAAFARLRSQGAIGDVCGRFFDRDGREILSPYRERVMGVELDVLRRLFVVGVTHGASRAAATLAALRGGLIDALVIDEVGADVVLNG